MINVQLILPSSDPKVDAKAFRDTMHGLGEMDSYSYIVATVDRGKRGLKGAS